MAASLGGLRALQSIVPALPASFPVPVLIAQHGGGRELAHVLDWRASLSVQVAQADRPLASTGVIVVPAGTTIAARHQPATEIWFGGGGSHRRPADDLFAAAAQQFGPRL